MNTFQVSSLILLGSLVSTHARFLQEVNDTGITTDGNIEVLVSTAAPTETEAVTGTNATDGAAPTETASEVDPTEAVTGTNATDGGVFTGVEDWMGTAADTVANATDGFTEWLDNVVNKPGNGTAVSVDETGETDTAEESTVEEGVEAKPADAQVDNVPEESAGVAKLVSVSAVAATAASLFALF
jgi:hypothetical protein